MSGKRLNREEWVASYATDTRLMGVVALKTYTRDGAGQRWIHLVHLDYETYGVDGLLRVRPEEDEAVSDDVYGGLGGKLVPVTQAQAHALIRLALSVGAVGFDESLQSELDLYGQLDEPDEQTRRGLYESVCTQPRSIEERLHYYLMRLVGNDLEMTAWLSDMAPPAVYPFGCTLVRSNAKYEGDDIWSVSVTILEMDKYYVDRFLFTVQEGQLVSGRRLDHLAITTIEAAMQLRHPEWIRVLDVGLIDDPEEWLQRIFRHKMAIPYGPHLLITVFHPHNDHVNQPVYLLDGDVEAMIYLTDEDQLLIVGQDEMILKRYESLVKATADGYNVELIGEFSFSHQILVDFIESGEGDFLDFASEEIDEW